MEKITPNKDNHAKYNIGRSTASAIIYKKDENGDLILDENGNPIIIDQFANVDIQYFTE